MKVHFREVEWKDRDFLLSANEEINLLSGLSDSTFEKNIDKDLFKDKLCKVILAEVDKRIAGFILYSYIYWANCGKGIYLSQVYTVKEFRNQGIFKLLLHELERREPDCCFLTDLVGKENDTMMHSLERLEFKSSSLITYYKRINNEIAKRDEIK